MLDTSDMQAPEKFAVYRELIGSPAVRGELDAGLRVIVGLRVTTPTTANERRGIYDDRFVVLQRTKIGDSALEFAGNADPSGWYEDVGGGLTAAGRPAMGVDVDRDGRLDLGRIPAGCYRYRKSQSKKFGGVLRSVEPIHAERDTNHDGVFDGNDRVDPAQAGGLHVTDFLFHPGLDDRTGSAGCQTMTPDVFRAFWQALGDQEEFWYVLITVG
jgi:hypothetical protein